MAFCDVGEPYLFWYLLLITFEEIAHVPCDLPSRLLDYIVAISSNGHGLTLARLVPEHTRYEFQKLIPGPSKGLGASEMFLSPGHGLPDFTALATLAEGKQSIRNSAFMLLDLSLIKIRCRNSWPCLTGLLGSITVPAMKIIFGGRYHFPKLVQGTANVR